jgi:hypothetical protein
VIQLSPHYTSIQSFISSETFEVKEFLRPQSVQNSGSRGRNLLPTIRRFLDTRKLEITWNQVRVNTRLKCVKRVGMSPESGNFWLDSFNSKPISTFLLGGVSVASIFVSCLG